MEVIRFHFFWDEAPLKRRANAGNGFSGLGHRSDDPNSSTNTPVLILRIGVKLPPDLRIPTTCQNRMLGRFRSENFRTTASGTLQSNMRRHRTGPQQTSERPRNRCAQSGNSRPPAPDRQAQPNPSRSQRRRPGQCCCRSRPCPTDQCFRLTPQSLPADQEARLRKNAPDYNQIKHLSPQDRDSGFQPQVTR